MSTTNKHPNELAPSANIREYRKIALTSKRQLTIPKVFCDYLGVQNSFIAWLTDEGIYLKPFESSDKSLDTEDRKEIILGVLSEGGTPEEMADEIARRLEEYDKVIEKRIREFEEDAEQGEESLNGLEIFTK